jgi:hypothetical protein
MDVAAAVAVDLADEAQGQVDLVVGLPARRADPAHRPQQDFADSPGRADGDEQAVHDPTLAKPGIEIIAHAAFASCLSSRFSLKWSRIRPIFRLRGISAGMGEFSHGKLV